MGKVILTWILCTLNFSPLAAKCIQWSPPTAISSSFQDASDPHVGIDGNGDVIVVWVENDLVRSSTLPINGIWSDPMTLSGQGASSPQLVVDSDGNATAVWLEKGIVKSSSQPWNKAWGPSIALSNAGASSPQIAVDAVGNVVAVWVSNNTIQSATKLLKGSWPVSPDIISDTGSDSPQVAIGANGQVVAVWHGVASSVDTIFSAGKLIEGQWNGAQSISDPSYNSIGPQVAVDSNGNAAAVWFRCQVDGSVYSNVVVQSAAQSYLGKWTTPIDLSSPGMFNPAKLKALVAFDGIGNLFAIWNTSFLGSLFNCQVAAKPVNGGWTAQTDLISSNLYSYSLDIDVDINGDGLAVVMDFDTRSSSLCIQYSKIVFFAYNNSIWSTPLLTLSGGTANGYPHVAVSSNKDSVFGAAIWINYNGKNNTIHAVTGIGEALKPPTFLSVTQGVHDLGILKEYYNTIQWQPSPSSDVVGYLIFRNGVLINYGSPSLMQVIDNNRGENEPVTYSIMAYDDDYSQSPMATISFP